MPGENAGSAIGCEEIKVRGLCFLRLPGDTPLKSHLACAATPNEMTTANFHHSGRNEEYFLRNGMADKFRILLYL
jgi:hypothetical protein